MAQAFLGIVTPRGLELVCREEEHTARFLHRRLRHLDPLRAFCIWFVADSQIEAILNTLIASSQYEAAWAVVERHARDRGVQLPDHQEFEESPYIW